MLKIAERRDCDVLVCGGGTAGLAAAVSAARNGARTILLERYGFCGGIAVGAIVLDIMDGSIVGVRVVRNPDKLVRLTAHLPESAAPGLASPTT